ncbi:DUF3251 domain-containing protein [Pantoea sp. A4]|uniref:DUF3251 domain-containing protein n=1 Tax=Pantoea sp. A4 TaxID=1225184 RepID=UPI0003626788|nr:DUF3251 domain-containing protein [Pantoea sp. A4]
MFNRTLCAPFALSLLILSGCSSTAPSPQVKQLHQEVSQLSQQMQQLTGQAEALETQGQLNSQAAQGAWLLPLAKTPVLLQTQLGEIRLSLGQVKGDVEGSRVDLTLSSSNHQPLPALSASVVWGELDPTSGKPLNASSQQQTLVIPASLTPQSSVTVPLHLGGLAPEQLGFIRVHDVMSNGEPLTH